VEDDLRRTAGRSWMRVEDRARLRDIGEAYVQQWIDDDDDDDEKYFIGVRSRKLSNIFKGQ
jgi:hypothetical protein